ncbi:DNA/RNA helicase domain-containing protein [Falsiroseomonas sp. HC035]|uniref:DNA/RNA helicase domain-containing protein n=1 Tax=Falsiroseomonas sp. HC035 TaxID=3390999 RepID=UPI003D30F365
MRAWLSCTGFELLARDPADIVGRLAAAQQARGYPGSPDQDFAWRGQVAALRQAVAHAGGAAWTVALEYDLLRLEKRVDAVLLTDRAILALEFKTAAATPAALAEAEDYALDLRDFHAGSRHHPILPVLVAGEDGFHPPAQPPLFWDGVLQPLACGAAGLGDLLAWVQSTAPVGSALDGAAWLAAPYRPVPTIVEAATLLYARNGVAQIASARADAANLTRTAAAISSAVALARQEKAKTVVFVTGIPGAGKTLCGLNAIFGAAKQDGAAFLTGNAPLIAVLRAALVQDAVLRGECGRAEAERRVKAALQNVHRFLEDNAEATTAPPERMIVFDEAQRAWDAAKARLGTRNRPSRLSMSEPGHTLDIMGRHEGWAVVVALIGQGQEINTGEAGLAEWGRVIQADPRWRAVAAPRGQQGLDVPGAGWLALDPALDLVTPIRSIRETAGAAWVDAVLRGAVAEARDLAAGCTLPFLVTRDLPAMRAALRGLARGQRRAGLLASAGAKRLRAEGLGVQLEDVADWFLRRWPDVRGSDALETIATEYDCQGLELDVAGLAWGGDFIRRADTWQARNFVGAAWQRAEKDATFIRNTYRVLLTRARYETIIWVPRGSPRADPFHDPTRDSAEMDAVAEFLLACGARPLEAFAPPAQDAAPALLL